MSMILPTWEYKRKEQIVLRSSEFRANRPAAVRPCGLKNGKVGYNVKGRGKYPIGRLR